MRGGGTGIDGSADRPGSKRTVRAPGILRRRLYVACLALIGLTGAAWAEANAGVVSGAERVVIRRGPGKQYPPVAAIGRGSRVEIQEVHGQWARIVTARGEKGYVKRSYLVVAGEHERHAAQAPAATPAATSHESAAAALQAATERNKSLEAELQNLRQELADLKSRAPATPAAPLIAVTPATEQLRTELTRLAAAVEALQRRLDTQAVADPAPSSLDGSSPPVSATSVLFAMIGILVGWLVGGTYSRKQERGRRSRIRF